MAGGHVGQGAPGASASVSTGPAVDWVVASSNTGKIRELDALLAPLGVRLRTQRELGIDDADEPFATFVENALAKARHASRRAGMPGVADDSGICVPALGGSPGVRSARFGADWIARRARGQGALADAVADGAPAAGADRATIDAFNNRCLLEATASLAAPVACFYYCAVVFVRHADDPCPIVADGAWHGTLARVACGANGFGYDPHFVPDGHAQSVAAMSPEAKNGISHRALAIAGLVGGLRRHRLA
ncbi:MAG: non-canonical purine NTP pyrophosphatase [Lautropia sp.]